MFTRVTFKDITGTKTRFQFGACAQNHPVDTIGKLVAFAVSIGCEVTITYSTRAINNRSTAELIRVNQVLDKVML